MGRLVVTELVSIDGIFEDPGSSEDDERGLVAIADESGER
jgi:hypothetical protein